MKTSHLNRMTPAPDPDAFTYIAMEKGDERYIVCYSDANVDEALKTLGRWAANPELSFTWYDAARLSYRIRSGR